MKKTRKQKLKKMLDDILKDKSIPADEFEEIRRLIYYYFFCKFCKYWNKGETK